MKNYSLKDAFKSLEELNESIIQTSIVINGPITEDQDEERGNVRVFNIDWDDDSDLSGLPAQVYVTLTEEELKLPKEELDELLGNILTDMYGFLHNSFDYEILEVKETFLENKEAITEAIFNISDKEGAREAQEYIEKAEEESPELTVVDISADDIDDVTNESEVAGSFLFTCTKCGQNIFKTLDELKTDGYEKIDDVTYNLKTKDLKQGEFYHCSRCGNDAFIGNKQIVLADFEDELSKPAEEVSSEVKVTEEPTQPEIIDEPIEDITTNEAPAEEESFLESYSHDEYFGDTVAAVLDRYGFLYGDIVDNNDGSVNIVGVEEDEWEEVGQALKHELADDIEVIIPDEDHEEFDDELIVIFLTKEDEPKETFLEGKEPRKAGLYIFYGLDDEGNTIETVEFNHNSGKISDLKAARNKLFDNDKVTTVYVSIKDGNNEKPLDIYTIEREELTEALKEESKDFFGTKEGSEEADDLLFGLQVEFGQPKYGYDDFRKMDITEKDLELAKKHSKELNKFTYFENESLEEGFKKITADGTFMWSKDGEEWEECTPEEYEECGYEDLTENDYEDFSITDIDETSFDEAICNYMRENYENFASYKTLKGFLKDSQNKIILEGKITFTSNKEQAARFMLEAIDSYDSNIKFKLICETFADVRSQVNTTLNEGLLKCESLKEDAPSNETIKCRLIWDDCTPTRERRSTTPEDIEDDIHIEEFNSEEEVLEALLGLANTEEDWFDEEEINLPVRDKIQQILSYFSDPGDGSPNILYLSINGEVVSEDLYDCLIDASLDLEHCSEDDVIEACKAEYEFEDWDDDYDDDELDESKKDTVVEKLSISELNDIIAKHEGCFFDVGTNSIVCPNEEIRKEILAEIGEDKAELGNNTETEWFLSIKESFDEEDYKDPKDYNSLEEYAEEDISNLSYQQNHYNILDVNEVKEEDENDYTDQADNYIVSVCSQALWGSGYCSEHEASLILDYCERIYPNQVRRLRKYLGNEYSSVKPLPPREQFLETK